MRATTTSSPCAGSGPDGQTGWSCLVQADAARSLEPFRAAASEALLGAPEAFGLVGRFIGTLVHDGHSSYEDFVPARAERTFFVTSSRSGAPSDSGAVGRSASGGS
jgi:hypothetical protein